MNAKKFREDIENFYKSIDPKKCQDDKKILKKEIWLENVTTSNKIRSQDPSWQENRKKLIQDPTWIENQKKGAELNAQDPIWRENQKKAMELRSQDPSWIENQKKGAELRSQDPSWIENQKKGAELNAQDPIWRKNIKKGAELRSQDPSWIENQKKGAIEFGKTIMKPLITPDGIFESRKAAAEFYGIKACSLSARMRSKPSEFYYISQEEYELIKDNELNPNVPWVQNKK
jgi:hypothetical protein